MNRTYKSVFCRNVMWVASGALAAQAISLAFAPVLTRIYTPEALGVLGTFTAILAVAAPFAGLGYPLAIVLPRDSSDAAGLSRLSLLISVTAAAVASLLLWGGFNSLVEAFSLQPVAPFLWLIPPALFLAGVNGVLAQWVARLRSFRLGARVEILQAALVSGGKVGVGFAHPAAAVLVALTLLGSAFYTCALTMPVFRAVHPTGGPRSANKPSLLALATTYRRFPLYKVPQMFLRTFSDAAPLLMLAVLAGSSAAGFYAVAQKVLSVPSSLVAESLRKVFYPRFSEAHHQQEPLFPLLFKATVAPALIGIFPFGLVAALGHVIFPAVFGSAWTVAGEYAQWLSVLLYFFFVGRPAMAAVLVLNLQKALLGFEIVASGLKLGILWWGLSVFSNEVNALAIFSLTGALLSLGFIFFVLIRTRAVDRVSNLS